MENVIYNLDSGRDLSGQVLSKFSIALLLMTVGMVVGAMFIPPAVAAMMPIVCLVMLVVAVIARSMQRKKTGAAAGLSMGFVYAFAALEGVGLYPTLMYYAQSLGANLVMAAFAITFVLFFGLATYAKHTKRDFIQFGSLLFMGVIALLLVSIAGIFIQATALQVATTAGGIFIFSGYVLYDIQVMRSEYMTEAEVPMMVLSLFLDFINLFLYVLRALALFSSND